MPTRRVLAKISVLVLLMGSSGCYSFGILRSDLPSTPPEVKSEVVLRVTPVEGTPVLLRNPWVNPRVVGGVVNYKPWKLPLADVDLIEEKYYDRGKTARFVAYVVGISLGLLGWEQSGW